MGAIDNVMNNADKESKKFADKLKAKGEKKKIENSNEN